VFVWDPLLPSFNRLRLPKADTFSSASTLLDEFNSCTFERPADGGFIRKCDWDFPVNNFRSAYRGDPHL
jgi:hypothetical protein